MNQYTVEEIAKLLGKSPETVRRLIRTGALSAPKINSTKEGFKITTEALKTFLDKYPKYLNKASAALISSGALALPMVGLVAGIVSGLMVKNKNNITADQVEKIVINKVASLEKKSEDYIAKIQALEQKKKELQDELEIIQNQILSYRNATKEDFISIADNINENIKDQ